MEYIIKNRHYNWNEILQYILFQITDMKVLIISSILIQFWIVQTVSNPNITSDDYNNYDYVNYEFKFENRPSRFVPIFIFLRTKHRSRDFKILKI